MPIHSICVYSLAELLGVSVSAMQDVFVTELVKTQKYKVMSSEQLKAKLKEKNLSLNGKMSPSDIAKVGLGIGVDGIVIALFEEYGSVDSVIRVRVIESATGATAWKDEIPGMPKINNQADFDKYVKPAIQKLVASLKAAV
jgi:hypothetical protein